MDTSETYIKMSDTPEIQSQHDWSKARPCGNGIVIGAWGDWYWETPTALVWLPLQHQLQEMVRREFVYEELNNFNYWFDDEVYARGMLRLESYSWEQLWLAFVMKEKYHKTWNGGDWV